MYVTVIDNVVDLVSANLIKYYSYNVKADNKGLKELYYENKPIIQELYSQAFYWHGTGRYHYKHKGESKYHSEFTDELYDVLLSIIDNNGLTPQYDFWTNISSISLTKNRIYARAYSEFHQNELEPLTYTYGSTRFWFYVLGIKQIFTNNLLHNIRRMNNMHKDRDFNQKFQQWAKYVRRDTSNPVINMFTFYKLRSDIPDNYGILFGIKKEAVEELKYNPTIERFESRCVKPITFDQMTHLEVPMRNLKDTKLILEAKGINIPVLPIELTEIYCSTLGYSHFA